MDTAIRIYFYMSGVHNMGTLETKCSSGRLLADISVQNYAQRHLVSDCMFSRVATTRVTLRTDASTKTLLC